MTAFSLAGITAIFYAILFPPIAISSLAWVALVPLCLALDGAGWKRSATIGGLFGFFTTVMIVGWLAPTASEYFEQSRFTTLLFVFTVGLASIAPYFALCFGLLGAVQRHLPRLVWMLLIPAAWVTAELLRTQFGLRSSWCLLGVSQSGSLRVAQIADVTGVYGVSGLVVLANVCVAEAIRVGSQWLDHGSLFQTRLLRPFAQCVAIFAGSMLATLIHGNARLEAPVASPSFEVALVQANLDPELRWKRGQALRVMQGYVDLTQRLVEDPARAPDLVVWPENALQKAVEHPLYGPPLGRAVERFDRPLLIGAPRTSGRGQHNSAALLEPGASPRYYDKTRLLPFSETHPIAFFRPRGSGAGDRPRDYVAGTRTGLFTWQDRTLGVLICFEAIYPSLARSLARDGAEVIVNLSNDGWIRGSGGPQQHLQQVVFRAIETRLPVLRSTTTGISALIAPSGRIVDHLEMNRAGVLRAVVPRPDGIPTLYVQWGDVFAHACAGALVAASIIAALRARARRPASARPAMAFVTAA